jgi:hypothetical protein
MSKKTDLDGCALLGRQETILNSEDPDAEYQMRLMEGLCLK